MTTSIPLQHKLLNLLYHSSRNYKPPTLINTSKLAKQWDCTPDAVAHALKYLINDGKIRRTDIDGNTIYKSCSSEARFLQYIIDNGGKILWDKPSRIQHARKLGFKLMSLKAIKYRVKDCLHVEYDGNGMPIECMIMDECQALLLIGDTPVAKAGHYRNHYYKYVSGYSKRKPKAAPAPKPPRKQASHRICEYVLAHGGMVFGNQKKMYLELGMAQATFRSALNRAVDDGLLRKTTVGVEIRDAEKVALFLAPFTENIENEPQTTASLPSGLPSRIHRGTTNAVTTLLPYSTTPLPPNAAKAKAVARFSLLSLIVKQRLQQEIAFRLLRYPKNYEKGQQTIANLYREVKVHDDLTDETRRQQQGAMYGQQKAICMKLLTAVQDYLGLGGLVLDALAVEAINHLQGALPTVEFPEQDLAERLIVWAADHLAREESDAHYWCSTFAENAKCELISEFVCRGGLYLMLRIMQYDEANRGIIDQRIAWDVISYLKHTERYPFNPRYPEQFQSIKDWDGLKMTSSFANGLTIADALYDYMGLDYKLGSLQKLKPLICKALLDMYPVKSDMGMTFTSAWNEMAGTLAEWEECETLEQWIEEETAKPEVVEIIETAKYTVKWYETKLRDVEKYGLPGDIDQLSVKISALKKWHRVSVEEQRNNLVPLLNKPGKYENPQLDWHEWNARADASRQGVDREWLEPID